MAILLRGTEALRPAGCHAYIVSVVDDDADLIHVTEVWDSKEHHHASLQLPETKASIAEAMPMLTGEFTSQELDVAGGLGVGAPSGPAYRRALDDPGAVEAV